MAAQAARGSDAGPDGWVEGTFNYLRRSTSDRGSLEVRSQSQADSATKKTVVASMFEPVKTRVRSARGHPELNLETAGFALAGGHPTSFTDWHSSTAVEADYYPEMERVARRVLSQHGLRVQKAVCVNHIVRDESGNGLGPHRVVHNDYTETYPARIRAGFARAEREGLWTLMTRRGLTSADFGEQADTQCRLVVVNLWRSRSAVPLKTAPLAMCDRRSVATNDLCPVRLPGYNGETIDPPHEISLGHANPKHTWWYYPDLGPDEIICLKTFDTAAQPFVPTLHSAFDDPTTPPRYRQRESIEARVVCVIPQGPSAKL